MAKKNEETSTSSSVEESTTSQAESQSAGEEASSSEESASNVEKVEAPVEENESSTGSEDTTTEEEEEAEKPKAKVVKAEKAEESTDESTEQEDKFNSAGRTVFMKNFSGDLTEEEIKAELEKLGEIHELRVPKKREHKKTRGFLICCFKNRKSVVEALKLNNTDFLNCKIYVEELKDGLKKREDHKTERTEKRVFNKENEGERATAFVSNLPYEVDEYAFKKYIENLGSIRNIRIPQDKETGRKRGFAFFEFNDKSDMEKMMKMNLIWDDRKLFMRESEPRREDGGRDGRSDSRDRSRGNGRDVERKSYGRDNNRGGRDNNRNGRDNGRNNRDNNKGRYNNEDRENNGNAKKIKFEDSDE